MSTVKRISCHLVYLMDYRNVDLKESMYIVKSCNYSSKLKDKICGTLWYGVNLSFYVRGPLLSFVCLCYKNKHRVKFSTSMLDQNKPLNNIQAYFSKHCVS